MTCLPQPPRHVREQGTRRHIWTAINEITKQTGIDDVTTCATVSAFGPSNEGDVFQNRVPGNRRFLEISWAERAWRTKIVLSLRPDWDILEPGMPPCWRL